VAREEREEESEDFLEDYPNMLIAGPEKP